MGTFKVETGKAYSMFGKSGMMEEIKSIPNLPIGCKIFCYGFGMSEREGAIISDCDSNGSYKGVYISDYESGFFTFDKYSKPLSKKFGIGHYFDDNLETFEDNILEDYILKAEIAEKLRIQAEIDQLNADNQEKLTLPSLYPHLIVNTRDDHATTKKNIVAELKKNFSNFKFSVKKEYYGCYNISWTNGPTDDEVDCFVKKFEDYETDFTGDFRDPNPSNFNKVFGGFKYVSTSRKMNENFEALLQPLKVLEKDNVSGYYSETHNLLYRIFRKTSLPIGAVISGIEKKINFSGNIEDLYIILFDAPKTILQTMPGEPIKLPTTNLGLELVEYSDKALAVFGDTKAVKDVLKTLGGRYNPALTYKGEKKCGWIFPKSKENQIKEALIF